MAIRSILYAAIEWGYNQTTPAQSYADAQDVIFNDSIKVYVDAQVSAVTGDIKSVSKIKDETENTEICSKEILFILFYLLIDHSFL